MSCRMAARAGCRDVASTVLRQKWSGGRLGCRSRFGPELRWRALEPNEVDCREAYLNGPARLRGLRADFGDCDHAALGRRLHPSWIGRVSLEREVRPRRLMRTRAGAASETR
jgi:hypothetical protein